VLALPYEAQPEQNVLAHVWQANGGRVAGYIHSTMLTFPGHYLRPNAGAPDELWVHGSAYRKILNRIGWECQDIKQVRPYRFLNSTRSEIDISGLFFPYWSGALFFALRQVEQGVQRGALFISQLKPHPSTAISKRFNSAFSRLVSRGKLADGAPKQAISIGPVSVPLEELERGSLNDVIHVPLTNAVWDSFDSDIWHEFIHTQSLFPGSHVYRLNLIVRGSFIDFDFA